MRLFFPVLLFFANTQHVIAQLPKSIKIKEPVICYANPKNNPIEIPPPASYIQWKNNPQARTSATTFEITYIGFESVPQAQAAFQAAVDIWSSVISSSVPIKIEAYWATLSPGALGGAIYTSAFANFNGAQKLNVFYPIALAEKITGQNLNDNEPEIFAQFSSSTNWHFDPNTTPPPGAYDLVTVVLHEIGHGLGFAGSLEKIGSQGQWGLFDTVIPIIYDVPIENGGGFNLIETFISPSVELGTELISQNLFFDSQTSTGARLYAPGTFDPGSSISHLNDNTYDGTANSLMTHAIAAQERMHNPGIALNILKDMGWEIVKINHQQFSGSEDETGPYVITAKIDADNGYSTVKLNYTLNDIDFVTVTMTPTGNPDEYTANIPGAGNPDQYGYFLSVNDNDGREFVNPGKIVREQNTQLQNIFNFETGPDTQEPTIVHTPDGFILDSDTEQEIVAKITDNLGVELASVLYYKNDSFVGSMKMEFTTPFEDSIYKALIDLTSMNLAIGDQLKYRIVVRDTAVIGNPNGNIGYSPSISDFHIVNVVGLSPTQDSYGNDFNAPSDDFFGTGFEIKEEAGFASGALHTEHPYLAGDGLPGDTHELIYQLSIPIRVKNIDATLNFDEIVLVEPGETGSIFGDEDFYDYVVAEGSKDGGITWTPVAAGYDSRDNSAWLSRYNSSTSGNNSTATGIPSLYKPRTMDLRQKFNAGDEVVIRFRLFSDPFAVGWGWAIDNLKIQIDETPPQILHNHVDYLFDSDDALELTSKPSDTGGIKEFKIEYFVNSNTAETELFLVDPPQDEYIFSITGLLPLSVGDIFNYRFVATDNRDNVSSLPSDGYISVPVVNFFGEPISTYANNFNSASSDFVGNFFTISKPSGFTNEAIHSTHFYNNGFGLTKTSDFSYTLEKPISISEQNTYIRFDEIVIVQGQSSSVPFGTEAFNDYVIVEGSKDGGITWNRFLDGYDAISQAAWLASFNNGSNGGPSLFRTRVIDMTQNGNFSSGDEVIIRFRMYSDATTNGWGWAIDNLYIQDPITSSENELELSLSIYPNPVKENIFVEVNGAPSPVFIVHLLNTQGQSLYSEEVRAADGNLSHSIPISTLPQGIYFVKIYNGNNVVIRKIIKLE